MSKQTKDYAKNVLQELTTVIDNVDEKQLDQLVDLILEVRKANKKVYCAGAGRSLLMIRTFSMRLMHMGMRSYVVGETSTPAIEEGDLLIYGSGSGETGALCAMLKKAQGVGARIATITKSPNSTLAKASEVVVEISLDCVPETVQPAGSVFEQAMLILGDSMFLTLLEKGNILEGREINEYIRILHTNLE